MSALLPVPQIRQAHDLYLDPADAEPAAIVVAPPYPGMAANDTVMFFFVPVSGMPATQLSITVSAADVGKPISWALDSNDLWMAYADQVETFYEVAHVAGGTSASTVQIITIDIPPSARLIAPAIADHEGGGVDPELYPDGLTVAIPLYSDATVGDGVLLYWDGEQTANSTVKWQVLDTADITAGELHVLVEPAWLAANIGKPVTITYQYAREGAAGSSLALTVDILVPVVLVAPLVANSVAEGGGDNGNSKGFLLAEKALSGVYISVPPDAVVEGAVGLEVHWEGHRAGGTHVADAPHDAADPLRFHVPRTAIAANIGGEGKRFHVFYRATLASGRVYTSKAFELWIKPLPAGNYAAAQCREAQGKPGLSMADVPPEGVELYVTTWPLASAGQALTLWITGVSTSGTQIEHTVRDAVPATQAELDARAISGRLPKAVLQTLKPNNAFTMRTKVSYDGGDTAIHFMSSTVQWLG